MKKCPKCRSKVSFRDHFKGFFRDPSNYHWRCRNCGAYLKPKEKSRLITVIVSFPLAFLIFSKNYGLNYFIDNIVVLILIFLIAEFFLLYFEKIEVVKKDLVIENTETGRKEHVSKEDWEQIKASGSERNYKIVDNNL